MFQKLWWNAHLYTPHPTCDLLLHIIPYLSSLPEGPLAVGRYLCSLHSSLPRPFTMVCWWSSIDINNRKFQTKSWLMEIFRSLHSSHHLPISWPHFIQHVLSCTKWPLSFFASRVALKDTNTWAPATESQSKLMNQILRSGFQCQMHSKKRKWHVMTCKKNVKPPSCKKHGQIGSSNSVSRSKY